MYTVISLGFACQVKYNMNKYFESAESNFFDWLVVDFKSVLYVLQNINDKTLITKEKFTDQSVYGLSDGIPWMIMY